MDLWWATGGVAGVEVLTFQEDRLATSSTRALYKGKLEPGRQLGSITLCGRVFFFTLHSWATFFMLTNSNGMRSILEGGEYLGGEGVILWRLYP